jgi:NADH-ubiquinone oxidoreductase chain 4
MYNRVAFGGNYSRLFNVNIIDLKKREFLILLVLVYYTVLLGIYPVAVTDGLNYSVSELIY